MNRRQALQFFAGTPLFAGALKLDGDGDFMHVDDGPSFDDLDQLTVEAWICPEENQTSLGPEMIVSQYSTGAKERAWFLAYNRITDTIYGAVNEDLGNAPVFGSRSILPGVWTHVAMVYTGRSMWFLVNDVLDKAMLLSYDHQPIVASGQPIRFGSQAGTNNNQFTGRIGRTRLWSRALTTGDVMQAITCDVMGVKCPRDGLLAEYHFNSDVLDTSGNGNHGLLVDDARVVGGKVGR